MKGPTFLPKVHLRELEHVSERSVALALSATLDPDWTVYHNYCWLRPELDLKQRLRAEQRVDFLLMHPRYGMVVLEVRGGLVDYVTDSATWWQDEQQMACPFKKARDGLRTITETITEEVTFQESNDSKQLPFPSGYMVCFPTCNYDGALPTEGSKEQQLSDRDLEKIGKTIERTAIGWTSDHQHRPLQSADLNAIARSLHKIFRLVSSPPVQLSDEQMDILSSLSSERRVKLEGVAGSGKTLIGAVHAERMAQQQRRVLFLTHPSRRAVPTEKLENLKIVPLDTLAEPNPLAGERFDVLIVDVAEEIESRYWGTLEKLQSGPEAQLCLLYDRDRDHLHRESDFPPTDIHLRLSTNYRTPQSIISCCERLLGRPVPSAGLSRVGRLRILFRKTTTAVASECRSVLDHKIDREMRSPAKIAILYDEPSGDLLKEEIGGDRLTEECPRWWEGKAVSFSTVASFKGREAAVVIYLATSDRQEDKKLYHELYQAVSRTSEELIVITSQRAVIDALRG